MEVALACPAWRCSITFALSDLGMTGLSWSMITGPTVTRDCLCGKYSAICSSQSSRLSDTPACTVRWSSVYWSQLQQAASSLAHDRAVGWSGDVSGVSPGWWLRNSSILLASLSTVLSKAATIGGETQDGGPRLSEYPERTFDMLMLPWLIGESCRLDSASGFT